MKTVALLTLFLFSTSAFAQQNAGKKADSLYQAKQFAEAGKYYALQAEQSDFPNGKSSALYNMACSLALAGANDQAMAALKQAIAAGYDKHDHVLVDADLISLHALPEWKTLTDRIPQAKRVLNSDPAKVKFVTTDVHHFWTAYDRALKDTAHFRALLKQYYFDPASKGMNDYMSLKVGTIDFFVQHIRSAPRYYQAIRRNTLKTDQDKPLFLASYHRFKNLYDAAVFPDVYFVIGAFTSGGTVSDAGLLLGLNQSCIDQSVPLDELIARLRTRVNAFSTLPNIVAHELIHYQQGGMKGDTTTLSYVIKEGMADFIGELISGSAANPVLYDWAKGKEQRIWAKFQVDMYQNRYGNWIANSQQATADNLPDQGYWIGYQICRAYYEQASDKKQAIYEMLHIQDYRAFLAKSGWDKKLAGFGK